MSVGEGERERVSQLCKPLWECLNAPDSSPLSVLEYFIQFMAARDALHLLQFWFSVASFRNAASSSHTDSQSPTHPHRADVSPTVTAARVAVGEGNSGSVRDRENTCRDRERSPVCVLESGVADDGGTLLNKRSVVGDGVRGDGVSVNGAVREGRVEGGAPGTIEPYIARQTSLSELYTFSLKCQNLHLQAHFDITVVLPMKCCNLCMLYYIQILSVMQWAYTAHTFPSML